MWRASVIPRCDRFMILPFLSAQVEGAHKVHTEELRLKMDVAIGRAPPLTDGQMQGRLRHEAHELLAEFREHNKQVRSRQGSQQGRICVPTTRTSIRRTRSASDASRMLSDNHPTLGFGTHISFGDAPACHIPSLYG